MEMTRIKFMLSKSGINTNIFKAHSVRCAASSTAARAGVTVGDILNAADWSTETVFTMNLRHLAQQYCSWQPRRRNKTTKSS